MTVHDMTNKTFPTKKPDSCSGRVLIFFPRLQFDENAKEIKADKGIKKFSCWDHFVTMLFCRLGQAHSLRNMRGGLSTALEKVVHWGVKGSTQQNNLADGNEHRSRAF